MEQTIKYKDAIYTYADGGVLKGYTKRGTIPDGVPFIEWHGNKMPHRIWQTILAFFAWTYDTYKDEALVHLYYNEATGNWIAWAPPQRGQGMTVKTEENHVNWKQAEEFIGYVKIGTAHHHCSMKAFQSGTDHADECTGNGLHYTVGDMDKQFHDLHARAVFNGNMVEVVLDDWIELADRYRNLNLPPELLNTAYDYSLQSRAPKDIEVPQQWKDNFLRWTSSTHNYQGNGQAQAGFHTGMGNHAGHTSGKVQTIGVSEGKRGYWRRTNGVEEFVPFAVQNTASRTPSEKAEEKLEALMRSGVTTTELLMIAEDLRQTLRADWTGDKNTLAVIEILNSNGLNVRWLDKYIEWVESAEIGKTERDQSQWEGMGA